MTDRQEGVTIANPDTIPSKIALEPSAEPAGEPVKRKTEVYKGSPRTIPVVEVKLKGQSCPAVDIMAKVISYYDAAYQLSATFETSLSRELLPPEFKTDQIIWDPEKKKYITKPITYKTDIKEGTSQSFRRDGVETFPQPEKFDRFVRITKPDGSFQDYQVQVSGQFSVIKDEVLIETKTTPIKPLEIS